MYIFLGRRKDFTDRDACVYIEDTAHTDICDHVIFNGACYSGFYEEIYKEIEDGEFESFLTRDELLDFLNNVETKKEKYIEILQSKDAIDFKNKIMQDEHEQLKDEYGFSDEDIEAILDTYYLDYEDKAIICRVFKDAAEIAEDYLEIMDLNIPTELEWYIDYDGFGRHLVEDDCDNRFVDLHDGRIAELSY